VGIFGNLRCFTGDAGTEGTVCDDCGVICGVDLDEDGLSIQSLSHSQQPLHLQFRCNLKKALPKQANKYFKDIYNN
jgi:hypothetical protein